MYHLKHLKTQWGSSKGKWRAKERTLSCRLLLLERVDVIRIFSMMNRELSLNMTMLMLNQVIQSYSLIHLLLRLVRVSKLLKESLSNMGWISIWRESVETNRVEYNMLRDWVSREDLSNKLEWVRLSTNHILQERPHQSTPKLFNKVKRLNLIGNLFKTNPNCTLNQQEDRALTCLPINLV